MFDQVSQYAVVQLALVLGPMILFGIWLVTHRVIVDKDADAKRAQSIQTFSKMIEGQAQVSRDAE